MKVRFCIALFSILLSSWGKATTVDSLTKRLDEAIDKSTRVEILHELAWQLAGTDNDLCLSYAEQSLDLALTMNSKEMMATSYNRIGLAYDYASDFDNALDNYEACRLIREDLGDIEGISASYNNIGGVYYYKGDYDKALEYYLESLHQRQILQKGDDPEKAYLLRSQSHNNIAMVLKAMRDYDEAIEYYRKSMRMKRSLGDELGECTSLANIGALYLEMDNRDSARSSLERALQIATDLENSYNITMCQNNLGLLELKEGKFDAAIERYLEIIRIEIESTSVLGEGTARVNLSSALLQKGDYQTAIHQAHQALEAGNSSGSLVLQQNALHLLSESYKASGNYQSSMEYYEQYITIKDSMFNIESDSKYNNLLVEYETEKKQDSITELNYQNELLAKDGVLKEQEIEKKTWIGYLLAIGIFCLLLAIFFLIRNAKIKKEALIRENELQLQAYVKEMDGIRARLEGALEDQPKTNLSIDQTLLNDYLMNPLSERELDVLKEVADGKTNKEIADALFVSVNTIKTHILNIYDKLDVQNRTQAAVKAGSLQILEN